MLKSQRMAGWCDPADQNEAQGNQTNIYETNITKKSALENKPITVGYLAFYVY